MSIQPENLPLAPTRIRTYSAPLLNINGASTVSASADGKVATIDFTQVANRAAVFMDRFNARPNGYRLWVIWVVKAGTIAGSWAVDCRIDPMVLPGYGVQNLWGEHALPVDGLTTAQYQRTAMQLFYPLDNQLYNIRVIRTATAGVDTFTGTISIVAIELEGL